MFITPSSCPALWLACICLFTAFSAPAQTANESSNAPTPPASAVAAPSPRPNPVTLAAAQQGVLACSSRINQVVSALGVDDKAGAMLMLPPVQQDQRLVSVALELPAPLTGGSAYVSTTFAPNQANGCGAGFDAVAYWAKSCEELGKQNFSSLKSVGQLKTNITVLDGGPAIKIFLMPAGAGCVSIKREIVL